MSMRRYRIWNNPLRPGNPQFPTVPKTPAGVLTVEPTSTVVNQAVLVTASFNFVPDSTVRFRRSDVATDLEMTQIENVNGTTKFQVSYTPTTTGDKNLMAVTTTNNAQTTISTNVVTLPVTATTPANTKPQPTVVPSATTMNAGGNLTLTITSNDPENNQRRYEIYNGTGLIQAIDSSAASYAYLWQNVAAGTYDNINVKVIDAGGLVGTAVCSRVTVVNTGGTYFGGGSRLSDGSYAPVDKSSVQWTVVDTPFIVDNSSTADWVLPPGNYQYLVDTFPPGGQPNRMIDYRATNGRRVVADRCTFNVRDHVIWGPGFGGKIRMTNCQTFFERSIINNKASGRVVDMSGLTEAIIEHNYMQDGGGWKLIVASNAVTRFRYNRVVNANGIRTNAVNKPVQYQALQLVKANESVVNVDHIAEWNDYYGEPGKHGVEDWENYFKIKFKPGSYSADTRINNALMPENRTTYAGTTDRFAGGGVMNEECSDFATRRICGRNLSNYGCALFGSTRSVIEDCFIVHTGQLDTGEWAAEAKDGIYARNGHNGVPVITGCAIRNCRLACYYTVLNNFQRNDMNIPEESRNDSNVVVTGNTYLRSDGSYQVGPGLWGTGGHGGYRPSQADSMVPMNEWDGRRKTAGHLMGPTA